MVEFLDAAQVHAADEGIVAGHLVALDDLVDLGDELFDPGQFSGQRTNADDRRAVTAWVTSSVMFSLSALTVIRLSWCRILRILLSILSIVIK